MLNAVCWLGVTSVRLVFRWFIGVSCRVLLGGFPLGRVCHRMRFVGGDVRPRDHRPHYPRRGFSCGVTSSSLAASVLRPGIDAAAEVPLLWNSFRAGHHKGCF